MNIYCPIHNNEIIQIDVDINTPLGERAVCIECPSKSRENIARILQKYKDVNKPIVDEIRQLKNIQINSQKDFKKSISNIQDHFNLQINKIVDKMENENNNILINLIEKEKVLQVHEEEQLTLSKLQNIAQMVVLSANNMDPFISFQEEYQQTIKSIEIINQQLSTEIEQLRINVQSQLNQISEHLLTYTRDFVKENTVINNESFYKSSFKCKQQVIYQLDQNYDTCAFNDKLLFLTNKNQQIIDIYKLEVKGIFKKLSTSLNDVISLGLNEQQLFLRSSENGISIYQIDNSFVQKQTIIRTQKDEGWNTCMVSIEKKQFLICAQPSPKIIIYIKDQESQKWSEHQVIEGFCWPVQDLSCHHITMNIVICTPNKDIFVWKQTVTKNNQIKWVPLCDPIKKAHIDRIYSVSWVKTDQFISGGLEIKNWKQDKSGSFINIQKLEKYHIIQRLCYLINPNIVIIQEQENCLDICYIDDKDQLIKQDSIKGNYKIISVSQGSSSIAVNNVQNKMLQILRFYY
ncbi:unnamed protein product [Paramecium primaurelia]|uniref:WD40-repeat-containing domain n=1 Tax=Paramecium primaurelia TaxID=5886 RepID=A0A8S1PZ45_PARPR|nr:unnamed protein product [Paramecium primaurelia]